MTFDENVGRTKYMILADDDDAEKQILREIFNDKVIPLEVTESKNALAFLDEYENQVAFVIFGETFLQNRSLTYIQKFINRIHRDFVNKIPVFVIAKAIINDEYNQLLKIGITDIFLHPINRLLVKNRINSYLELFNYRTRLSKFLQSAWQHGSDPNMDSIENADLIEQISELWKNERTKFNNLMNNYSGELVINYNAAKDIIEISDTFAKTFGINQIVPNGKHAFATMPFINSDDRKMVLNQLKALSPGKPSFTIPIRLTPTEKAESVLYNLYVYSYWVDDTNKPSGLLCRLTNISEQMEDLHRWRKYAQTDSLTGLNNRDSFYQSTIQILSNGISSGEKCAIFMIDIDNFKTINDTHGHLWGDAVISAVGKAIRSSFRESDIVARIGGDEFTALMRNISSNDDVARKARMISEQVYKTMRLLNHERKCFISVSIGIAISQLHGNDYDELLGKADKALYKAKQNGKNTFLIYNDEM